MSLIHNTDGQHLGHSPRLGAAASFWRQNPSFAPDPESINTREKSFKLLRGTVSHRRTQSRNIPQPNATYRPYHDKPLGVLNTRSCQKTAERSRNADEVLRTKQVHITAFDDTEVKTVTVRCPYASTLQWTNPGRAYVCARRRHP